MKERWKYWFIITRIAMHAPLKWLIWVKTFDNWPLTTFYKCQEALSTRSGFIGKIQSLPIDFVCLPMISFVLINYLQVFLREFFSVFSLKVWVDCKILSLKNMWWQETVLNTWWCTNCSSVDIVYYTFSVRCLNIEN